MQGLRLSRFATALFATLACNAVAAQGLTVRSFPLTAYPPSIASDGEHALLQRLDVSPPTTWVLGLADGRLSDLGLPSLWNAWVAGTAILYVPELALGVDLNGDGDTGDRVLHTHELATGITRNWGLALGASPLVVGSRLVLLIEERGLRDLNEDGDTDDRVASVLDLASGELRNLGVALVSGLQLAATSTALYLRVDEGHQGGTDLNGDGDSLDSVLHVLRHGSERVENLGLAVGTIRAADPFAAVGVLEADQGGSDLNGDGDALDSVLHVVDPGTLRVRNLGLEFRGFGLGLPRETHLPLRDDVLAFGVSEAGQGQDLDGDGDLDGDVFFQLDGVSGMLWNSGLPYDRAFVWSNASGYAILVEESAAGRDLDGDGDTDDRVLHFVERRSTLARNLGVSDLSAVTPGAGHLVVLGTRSPDEDECSPRLDLIDVTNGAVRTLHDDAGGYFNGLLQSAGFAVYYRCESLAGDLNGDGDTEDRVLHFADLDTGATRNTRLALSEEFALDFPATFPGQVFCNVGEAEQGADLNGDGDLDDDLLFLLEPRRADESRGSARSPRPEGPTAVTAREVGRR